MIKVGAATETEMKEKKARVEDALHATRAAVEEGIVPGGGVALLRASAALDNLKLEGDEQIGVNIVKRACEEPLRQIVGNAGTEGAIVVEKVRENKNPNFGYNAATDEYEDLVQAGVIDPTKVTRIGPAERLFDRQPHADHRSHDRRDPRKEVGTGSGRPRPRDGLLNPVPTQYGMRPSRVSPGWAVFLFAAPSRTAPFATIPTPGPSKEVRKG